MAYQFSGFFVKDMTTEHINTHEDIACIKPITEPFTGVGISIPKYLSNDPTQEQLFNLAHRIGLDSDNEWMFVVYECFGGQIDYLCGYIHKNGKVVCSVQESAIEKLPSVYAKFMAGFGVDTDNAFNFKAFERGFFE